MSKTKTKTKKLTGQEQRLPRNLVTSWKLKGSHKIPQGIDNVIYNLKEYVGLTICGKDLDLLRDASIFSH